MINKTLLTIYTKHSPVNKQSIVLSSCVAAFCNYVLALSGIHNCICYLCNCLMMNGLKNYKDK